MSRRRVVIVVAGPNGAGKSTAAAHLVPDSIEYVNADEIAKTLDTYPSREADVTAGRLVLSRLDDLERTRSDFAVETTLAGLSLASRITRLRDSGYFFLLVFLWTPSAEFSIARVASRVRAGGHSIPEATIRRRYVAGQINFFQRYRPLADKWEVFNSTMGLPTLVAEGTIESVQSVADEEVWAQLRSGGGNV
jgi:predicted ABC-type ATPase